MIYDHYGYPIFPGDRGYSSCGGDVERYEDHDLIYEEDEEHEKDHPDISDWRGKQTSHAV